MRTPNISSAFYTPGNAPFELDQLRRYVEDELNKVAAAISLLAAGHLDKSYAAPTKPRDGDIRYADGTTWKPNGTGGVGIWYFNGSVWTQLG
jgi:hypothetical protein